MVQWTRQDMCLCWGLVRFYVKSIVDLVHFLSGIWWLLCLAKKCNRQFCVSFTWNSLLNFHNREFCVSFTWNTLLQSWVLREFHDWPWVSREFHCWPWVVREFHLKAALFTTVSFAWVSHEIHCCRFLPKSWNHNISDIKPISWTIFLA